MTAGSRVFAAFTGLIALLAGCATIVSIPSEVQRVSLDSGEVVGEAGGGLAPCDPSKDFEGVPVPLVSITSPIRGATPRLSEDELTMYFDATGQAGSLDLYVVTRAKITDPFGLASRLPEPVNGGDADESTPNVTADGLTIVFERTAQGETKPTIVVASRASTAANFGQPSELMFASDDGGVATPATPFLRGDASEIWFSATVDASSVRLFVGRRKANGEYDRTEVENISEPPALDVRPVLSADRRTLFFSSDRPTGTSDMKPLGYNIWMSKRSSPSEPFGKPALVRAVSSDDRDAPGWVSADGCHLYLTRTSSGSTSELLVATRPR